MIGFVFSGGSSEGSFFCLITTFHVQICQNIRKDVIPALPGWRSTYSLGPGDGPVTQPGMENCFAESDNFGVTVLE